MMINKYNYHYYSHNNNISSLKIHLIMITIIFIAIMDQSFQIESIEMMTDVMDTNELSPPSPSVSTNQKNRQLSIDMAECHLRPVIHILQRAGCIPKPIPSFACYGTCNSYVQVSNSRFWQVERSCSCCQEIGEREASIMLHCPKQTPNYRKIITRAPVECLCRPCTAVDEHQIRPLEMHSNHHNDRHHQHGNNRQRRG